MPIHNLGYREWNGELRSPSTRWLVVADISIRRAWRSAWLRRMMFFGWVPGIVMGFMIFIYEQSAKQGGEMQDMMSAGAMALVTHENPKTIFGRVQQERILTGSRLSMGEERHLFWSALLQILFRRSQPFLLIPIVAGIAYEIIRFSTAHQDHALMRLLIAPGLALQKMTTREPDDTMVACAIAALRPVLAADGRAVAEPVVAGD